MNSSLLRENLKEGLLVAERIASKSSTLPILGNVLLSAATNSLEISVTDLEIGMRYQILAKTQALGLAVISPKTLSQFLGAANGQQVLLKKNEHGLEVECGEFHATCKVLNNEDFPIIPAVKGDEQFLEIDTLQLCQGLALVVNFTGQTQARPEISGVLFSFQQNSLRLASTDSFRLAEKTIVFKKEAMPERSFILPAKTARELVLLLGGRTGKVKIFFSQAQVIFDYTKEGEPQEPKIQLVSRLIEGEYPRYQDVIPQKTTTTAVLNREELQNHVKAASVFSGKTNDVRFVFEPSKKGVEISSKSADLGENASFLKGQVTGAKVEVAFNWRFLNDGLTQLKSQSCEFSLTGEDGAAVLKPVPEGDYLYVLMPIKA